MQKRNRCPGAGQRAEPATRGRLLPLWERKGKALDVPAYQETGAISLTQPQRGTTNGTLAGCAPAGRPARGLVGQRASGQSRGKSASGSAQRGRTLRSAKRGTECDLKPSRSISPAPDRHPNGPGLQARSAPADRAGRPKGSGN
jgi:hypothetical protein